MISASNLKKLCIFNRLVKKYILIILINELAHGTKTGKIGANNTHNMVELHIN